MAERKKIVVIDPGHGGTADVCGSSWQGSAGPEPNPLLEKDLTLSLAKAVRQRLSSTCDVTLTRESDVNVSLAGRAQKARDLHADLFLSIHFNAASAPGVDGTEAWVARQASAASTDFARTVLKHVALATGVANRGVRSADLGVLMPSRHDPGTAACLVEVAFLTNPAEASRLKDPVYLGQIADALADAVRAHTAVALTHAVAAGAGSGSASMWGDDTSVGLAEPHPVDDERYSEVMSAAELERLFALPLDVVIKTVVDSDARIRGGSPAFAVQGRKKIPRYTKVKVEEVNGDYSRVTGLNGTAYGWTASSNLGTYFKDDAALASAALAPASPIAIDPAWDGTRKAIAGAYNRLGGLIQTLASTTHIDVAAVLAVWYVESGGRAHTKGKAIIRFEVHALFGRWGNKHAQEFDAHFQFGTRPPRTGSDCDKSWKCHYYRTGDTGPFLPVHDNTQASEYAALAEAATLAGEEIAIQCISVGGSQILGANYLLIGYDTAKQMYDAFQDSERPHVLGLFDYCQYDLPHGALMSHLRKQEWVDFATGYNGSGNAAAYSAKLRDAYTAATAVLPATGVPATAKSLDLTLGNRSVDLTYAVPLIPQPDKLSCWAASMSMLLSYYRQAAMTPESLAQQAGLSLRTSYGWEMLEAVRRKFLFKEVSLPSNYSYVPPPEHWYQWLSQYGPLWITLRGNPSHAVVVSGICGDLTPGNTSIHLLNPWDTRVRFDGDAVDFHPANHGREETLSYDDFSHEFGNMGLADYGHWRILYLGRRADEVTHGLDVHDLTPEEIADAEPRVLEAWAVAAGVRPALGEADARWAPDDRSIDYRHLGVAYDSRPFTFTPPLLERLCALNRFDVKAGQDEVLFGLRGCQFADAAPAGWVTSASLGEAVPDHKNARCILGVWKRSTGQFRLFTASTVPNWKLMEGFRQGGDHANMLPTGRYLLQVGTHRAGTKGEVRGAFLEHGDFVVLRTLDDLMYAVGDTWDSGDFGDNIHPARLDGGAKPPFFSSAGCQTVPGNVHDGKHTGNWAEFRAAAGLSNSSPSSEDGRRFVYAMLTGRDARLIAQGKPDSALMRLRFGSSGADVTALQLGLAGAGFLKGGASGTLDAATKMAYIRWQTRRDPHTTDGVVTPSDGASLGFDMIRGQSIQPSAVSHALGTTRDPTPDEIVAQVDNKQRTSYGNYAGYRKTLIDGKVFGQAVSGVRPSFLKKLQAGEAAAATALGGSSPSFGIVSAGGFRQSEGFHGWGLAVDLNYHSAPYIMHNRGQGAIDRQVGPVYTRIARFMLKRESKIPKEITLDNRSAARVSQVYDWLAEEHDAMIGYFGLMQDTSRIAAAISAMPSNTGWHPISGGTTAPAASAMQDQMMKDYVALSGRGGPAITGKSYPAAPKDASHRPFHGDPKLRGPEKGFLGIRKEIVVALCAQGLRWGAIHFGGESGDVMHFDDGFGEGARILEAKKAAKDAIAAGQSVDLATLAAAAACAADIPIDEHSAVIYSDEAPLAKLDCERKAVWAAVPDPLRHPFSVLVYFHGNDTAVLADARHPEGIVPRWNQVPKPKVANLTPGGPFTPGTRDDLAAVAQSAPQRPLVLVPEDGVPSGQPAYWAETNPGILTGDPAALSRLTDDAWGHLANLKRPSGSPYLPGGPVCPVVRRLFLAGHSGGGWPLGYTAGSVMAVKIPTDLWLLDCTYYDLDPYVAFCRYWRQNGHLGNNAQSSRMVVITTAGKTRNRAQTILQKLQAAQKGQPGFSTVAFSRGQFTGGATTPPAGVDIVVVKDDAKWPEVDLCLRSFPVVFIETNAPHGRIPHDFFPHLLNTAAVP